MVALEAHRLQGQIYPHCQATILLAAKTFSVGLATISGLWRLPRLMVAQATMPTLVRIALTLPLAASMV
jgi:hypothetical protein